MTCIKMIFSFPFLLFKFPLLLFHFPPLLFNIPFLLFNFPLLLFTFSLLFFNFPRLFFKFTILRFKCPLLLSYFPLLILRFTFLLLVFTLFLNFTFHFSFTFLLKLKCIRQMKHLCPKVCWLQKYENDLSYCIIWFLANSTELTTSFQYWSEPSRMNLYSWNKSCFNISLSWKIRLSAYSTWFLSRIILDLFLFSTRNISWKVLMFSQYSHLK